MINSLSQQMELQHHSHQADFAQDLMSTICGEHHLETLSRDRLDFHYEGMRLPNKNIAIGTICYGANVAINISNLKAYSISLPLQGKQSLGLSGEKYWSDENKGLIVSNSALQDLNIDRHCKKIQVVIPEQSLQMVLAELIQRPVDAPIIFDPEMPIDSDQMVGAWWKNIQSFMLLKSQYSSFAALPMLSADYENFVIKALLLSQENNYSSLLREQSQQQTPEYIKNVKLFIMQHAHEEICVEDLQRIAGVSKSKLYEEFQQYCGTSPMSFLRKYRLQQINKVLSNNTQKISISKLAFDWGFNHLSRFSQEYREEFGEKPSETKRKQLRQI
ncbi:AraC-like DNA-binding protein [Acinetobacter calcoaceticus]|uniref:AraC-like DNA-binding protein n=1 Tax=Acinetobacter calcoaceticus TaxID=471 RepID=A0A4R1XWY8_ACICA|nr:AraC-like DNA-binding protein [Acinetobacter calcoaceticus]